MACRVIPTHRVKRRIPSFVEFRGIMQRRVVVTRVLRGVAMSVQPTRTVMLTQLVMRRIPSCAVQHLRMHRPNVRRIVLRVHPLSVQAANRALLILLAVPAIQSPHPVQWRHHPQQHQSLSTSQEIHSFAEHPSWKRQSNVLILVRRDLIASVQMASNVLEVRPAQTERLITVEQI